MAAHGVYRENAQVLGHAWETMIPQWLQEDTPSFDFVGFIVGEKDERAVLLGKAEGILAGVPFFTKIFEYLHCTVEWKLKEGDKVVPVTEVAVVHGKARDILLGERPALNLLARFSGIATRAAKAMEIVKKAGWHGRVAGTRKTTPGFRVVEKYGLLVGGADTHRYDLSTMVMLKDNVFYSAGSIKEAVRRARALAGFSLKIEVETSTEAAAEEAITAGADVVMLDNLQPTQLAAVSASLKKRHPHVLLEASGGITLQNLHEYCCAGVDIISLGSLTQGVPHIDFSLKIRH